VASITDVIGDSIPYGDFDRQGAGVGTDPSAAKTVWKSVRESPIYCVFRSARTWWPTSFEPPHPIAQQHRL
jgi:hypothetical protein